MDDTEAAKFNTLDYGNKLFAKVKEVREKLPEPKERYETFFKAHGDFARAYPLVFRYMIMDIRYSPRAFRKFLDVLQKDPGKGMEGYIERQADYARFLYMDLNRKKHPSAKKAYKVWEAARDDLMKYYNKMLEDEKEARNEFEELEKENMINVREELLDFLKDKESEENTLSPYEEEIIRATHGLPLKRELRIEDATYEQLVVAIKELQNLEIEALKVLETRNLELERLEIAAFLEEKGKPASGPTVILDLEWIPSTNLRKGKKKTR